VRALAQTELVEAAVRRSGKNQTALKAVPPSSVTPAFEKTEWSVERRSAERYVVCNTVNDEAVYSSGIGCRAEASVRQCLFPQNASIAIPTTPQNARPRTQRAPPTGIPFTSQAPGPGHSYASITLAAGASSHKL
jgi:hypothetical protein